MEKIIFLHIPKTAGTSLRYIIEKEYPNKECLQLYNPPYWRDTINQDDLSAAKVLYGHITFGIHKHLNIQGKYVAFVRNPIERVISFYNHNARQTEMPFYEKIKEGMSLSDMLESQVSKQTNNHMTRIIAPSGYDGMLDDNKVLKQALENIENHFLFVGLSENFAESIDFLGKKLKWKYSHDIPYLNVDPNKQSEIDSQTIAVLEKYNRLDILLYEYVKNYWHS